MLGHDQMLVQGDADAVQQTNQHLSRSDIVVGGNRVAARMVVRQQHGGSLVAGRGREHRARVEVGPVDPALGDEL